MSDIGLDHLHAMELPRQVTLRERNSRERERRIHLEGMRLFAERGYSATTVADVARAAGLAPRTVTLYYPAKLDIAMASTTAAARRLLAEFAGDGVNRSLADVVAGWLRSEIADRDPEVWSRRAVMFAANPELGSADTPEQQAVGRVSSELLARDLEVPLGHPAITLAGGALSGILLSFVIASAHYDAPALIDMTVAAIDGVVQAVRVSTHGKAIA